MNINSPLGGRGLAIPFTKAADPNANLDDGDLRLPFIHRIPDTIRYTLKRLTSVCLDH
jgi:aquaporin related protein